MKDYIKIFDRISSLNKEQLLSLINEFETDRALLRREKYNKGLAVDSQWHDDMINKLKQEYEKQL